MARKKSQLPLDLEARELAQLFGLTRVVLGAAMFVMPQWIVRLWLGDRRESTTTKVAMRGFGARDVALGMGMLMAVERETPMRGWLEAAIVSDVADATTALITEDVPFTKRVLSAAAAGVGVAWSLVLLPEFDE